MSTVELYRVVDAPVAELRENPANPRTISPERFDALMKSMEADPEMMRARPLIAQADGMVLAGNQRLKVAKTLGWETAPTVYVDLDDERARTWLLRDNNAYGDWDDDALTVLLADLEHGGIDLELTGFDSDELGRLLHDLGASELGGPGADGHGDDLDTFHATVGDPEHAVERGEVWRVGRHTLVCAGLFDGWPQWAPLLKTGMLFVPYPSPMLPLTARADEDTLLLLCPDPWLAGHVLDRYAEVRDADVERL